MNRREFLATSAVGAAALCASNRLAFAAESSSSGQRRLDLGGTWQFSKRGSDEWLPASVPGCVHTDLLASNKIPDPFFAENEKDVQWVGETEWVYRRTFQAPDDLLNHQRVLLRCEGLDTLATVTINGKQLGRADNMFRIWEFDVKSILKPGENTIEVAFESPLPYMKKRQAERVMYEWSGVHEPHGRAWVRKEPCNFGWDWGPVLITCGIWRDISLVAFDNMRLSDVRVMQDHSASGKVSLKVDVTPEVIYTTPFSALVTLSQDGKALGSKEVSFANGSATAAFEIPEPKLWWPAGMGAQPLYQIEVQLRNPDGATIERATRRIGLRTLKALPPNSKRSLRFEVNGVEFFAKGSNVIPLDAFANRVTPEKLRRLVEDAVAVNMNSLRFWGGGYYEDDALFDACDELGICVWLDFKFACSAYPAFNAAFMQNVKQEARDQIRRLRHHPCIAVWCGNNEISLMTKKDWSDKSMGQADYDKLFKELLASQVKELAPDANYVSGSPDCGDVHYWQVWHGGKPFEDYRSLTGFMSEFGFQSFPEPKTVRSYTRPEDRDSVMSDVMQWHQRSSGNGNQRIHDTTLRYFKAPKDFDSALWLSQILQAYGIKLGAEYWRQTMPKSMGCLFWQYNDCWPVTSWASVDYFGRWKALHYAARRFYAPLMVSGDANAKKATVDIHVTSDRLEPCSGVVKWVVTDLAGQNLLQGEAELQIPARQSKLAKSLGLKDLVRKHGAGNILVWLDLDVAGKTVSDNLVAFVYPKEMSLPEPQLSTSVQKSGGAFLVTVTAKKPALWAWLALEGIDARYSDNFAHVRPDRPVVIRVTPEKAISNAEFSAVLKARSLFDCA